MSIKAGEHEELSCKYRGFECLHTYTELAEAVPVATYTLQLKNNPCPCLPFIETVLFSCYKLNSLHFQDPQFFHIPL